MRAIANSMTTTKKVLRFAMLPGLSTSMAPVSEAWVLLARLLVQVFGSMGLIDASHPWMRATAKPRLLEVLSTVWAKIDWKHAYRPAPMVAVSITLMLAFGAIAAVFFASSFVLGAGQAFAASGPSLFSTPSPSTDLALKYISQAFGVPIDGVPSGAVDGVVEGFQQIMGLYSIAMLVLGGFILLYIISFAVMSTAHEGRFGGGSFNQVWAPIRLVVAIGLLVPLPMSGFNGYNSGQYIVMKLAELGSALASNLWVPFATSLANKGDMIGTPSIGPTASVVVGVLRNEFCRIGYNLILAEKVASAPDEAPIIPYTYVGNGGVRIVNYTTENDTSGAYCGSTRYQMASATGMMAKNISSGFETAYLKMRTDVGILAAKLATDEYISFTTSAGGGTARNIKDLLSQELPVIMVDYSRDLAEAVASTQSEQSDAAKDALTTEIRDSGWAGAGIWFNTISRLNSEVMSATRALPVSVPPNYGKPKGTSKEGETTSIEKDLKPRVQLLMDYTDPKALAQYFSSVGGYSEDYGRGIVDDVHLTSVFSGLNGETDSSVVGQVVNEGSAWFGEKISEYYSVVGGPFGSIGVGAEAKLSEINPLAELALIGDWILDKSLTLIGVSAGLSFTGKGAMAAFIALTIGVIGISAGILLLYVTPLLPFIRFLFAIAGWIMMILEAIIAIPLIAVAHLTTKGEGISGDLARSSYFLIFSIFLRPALLIIGLIVALMMFTVTIGILNDMYKYAILGFRGTGAEGAGGGLSVFMYTVLYITIAYQLCNMCFKLMEQIPNKAMTWISQNAASEVTHDEDVVKAMSQSGDSFFGVFKQTTEKRIGKMK